MRCEAINCDTKAVHFEPRSGRSYAFLCNRHCNCPYEAGHMRRIVGEVEYENADIMEAQGLKVGMVVDDEGNPRPVFFDPDGKPVDAES